MLGHFLLPTLHSVTPRDRKFVFMRSEKNIGNKRNHRNPLSHGRESQWEQISRTHQTMSSWKPDKKKWETVSSKL